MKRTVRWTTRWPAWWPAWWTVCVALLAGCASIGVRSTGTSTSADATTANGTTANDTSANGTSAGADTTSAASTSDAPDVSDEPQETGNTTGTTRPARPGPSRPDGPASNPDGIGDVLYSELGNPGLDVQHYDIDLTYDHLSETVKGIVDLDIRFTARRSEFTLDSSGPQIDGVQIDGADVRFRQDGRELRITPAEPIDRTGTARVEVRYHFTGDSHPASDNLPAGWFNTANGSYVLNEPDGARAWLPSNDHPSDKATYTFTVHVPEGITAVANGALTDHASTVTGDTWTWNERQPMSTYLIQLLTGDYELIDGTGPHGLPLTSAVLRSDAATAQPYINGISGQIAFFERFFGPYPWDSYGIAITDSFPGLAMETQGRSLFSNRDLDGSDNELVLSHELTHQWFGDAVSPERWSDIWLNESFATYGQWMWLEHLGRQTVQSEADSALSGRPPGATAAPNLNEMFGFTVYEGGATALHALRLTIGDDAFFQLLRQWVKANNGTSRTTADFIALAQKVSNRNLGDFFAEWIYAQTQPQSFPAAAPTPRGTTPQKTDETTEGRTGATTGS